MTSSTFTMLSMPQEVVEQILILCAVHGFPLAVTALSQTCKDYYALVYQSTDHHLWREVFLATFDDPRPVINRLKTLGVMKVQSIPLAGEFHWLNEFKQRFLAASYVRGRTASHTRSSSDPVTPGESKPSSLLSTLHGLNSAVLTSIPFPSSPTISFTISLSPSPSALPTYPAFPPLVLVASARSLPSVFTSRNAPWLENVLKRGYPPALTRRLLAYPGATFVKEYQNEDEELNITTEQWRNSEESRLFHKLVCCTGFLAIPEPEAAESSTDSDEDPPTPPLLRSRLTIERQRTLARRFARIIVYDLRYLKRERYWGPFMPVISGGDPQRANTEEEDGESDDLVSLIADDDDHTAREPVPVNMRRLYPDYAYLACVRILVEANLAEMLQDEPGSEPENRLSVLGDALRRLENARMGSAPGFWRAWSDDVGTNSVDDAENVGPGKGKGREEDGEKGKEVEGWDWAGVEGEWKRCVCWLDYRDLLVHNLHSPPLRFTDDRLEEVIRIIPMTLRISGYSRPSVSSCSSSPPTKDMRWPPTIHVEGEIAGPPLHASNMRRIKGTVSMVGDGAVRWSLTSSHSMGLEPEWATEGVQIGSVGSALGVLGMWTGAEHERTDPLGPFWAWKVA